jgi:hypothetical protein
MSEKTKWFGIVIVLILIAVAVAFSNHQRKFEQLGEDAARYRELYERASDENAKLADRERELSEYYRTVKQGLRELCEATERDIGSIREAIGLVHTIKAQVKELESFTVDRDARGGGD